MSIVVNKDPTRLYKYLKADHAESLVRKGGIRLGTLSGYKAMEALDPARGDKAEGHKINIEHIKHFDGTMDHPEYLKGIIQVENGGSASNTNIVRTNKFEDCYVYCMTITRNIMVLKDFKDAEVCVEIRGLKHVIKLIHQELTNRGITKVGSKSYLAECVYYKDSSVPFDVYKKYAAWQIKDTRFKPQNEARFVFPPNVKIESQYLDLEIPDIAEHCRIVPVDK